MGEAELPWRRYGHFAVGVLATVLASLMLGGMSEILPRLELATTGLRTTGEIIAKEPANHQALRYEYVVGDNKYQALDSSGPSTGPFDDVEIGQRATVVYLPRDPAFSRLSDSVDDVVPVALSLVILALVTGAATVALVASIHDFLSAHRWKRAYG